MEYFCIVSPVSILVEKSSTDDHRVIFSETSLIIPCHFQLVFVPLRKKKYSSGSCLVLTVYHYLALRLWDTKKLSPIFPCSCFLLVWTSFLCKCTVPSANLDFHLYQFCSSRVANQNLFFYFVNFKVVHVSTVISHQKNPKYL